MAGRCSITPVRSYAPPPSAPARRSEKSLSAPAAGTATVSRLENGMAVASDPLIDAIFDAYCVVTGVSRLGVAGRSYGRLAAEEYGEVKGL
jgi:hypothetical protein